MPFRPFLALSLLLAAAAAFPPASSAAEPAKTRKVLFLGLDGTRTDALAAADTPHLDALAKTGFLSTDCAILGPRDAGNDTVSGPGWSSIFTGVWADKHGVMDNAFNTPRYDQHPHFFALLRQARPDAVTASFVTWAPIHDHIVSAATVNEAFVKKGETHERQDEQAADAAVAFLKTADPDAVCVYIGQIDETGHAKGFHPNVPEYVAAIERADGLVGQVLTAVRARPTYEQEDWLVIATTDHGGRGTNHGGGHAWPEVNTVWLLVSGTGVTAPAGPTAIVDVVPTALTWLGVPLDPAWGLDGKPEGLPAAK